MQRMTNEGSRPWGEAKTFLHTNGREQQREAVARALVKNPAAASCVMSLRAPDYETGKAILKLLSELTGK
jgi:ABC-type lipoprotein export system ATPase subunit